MALLGSLKKTPKKKETVDELVAQSNDCLNIFTKVQDELESVNSKIFDKQEEIRVEIALLTSQSEKLYSTINANTKIITKISEFLD